MPQFYHKILPQKGELGLWKIEEATSFFLERLVLTLEEEKLLAEITERGQLEWLASRWLLHTMSGRATRGGCLKDEYGKPYLIDSPFQISISHSQGKMVAVVAAPYAIGIDIQKFVSKIYRIQHKFMRPIELESLEEATSLAHLHIYWGAKEALYKAYGRKKLGFKEHILITPFSFDLQKGYCTGRVMKEDYQKKFDIFYEKIEDYYLVYALEKLSPPTFVA